MATTVQEYLDALAPDRREELSAVRAAILANLPEGYEEGIQYGMIGYYVPHSIYPKGYHCNPKLPLQFMALASQKNYLSLHLMFLYAPSELKSWFEESYGASGKKLDMGKACLRFKKVDDLALDVIAEALRRMPVETYIAHVESALNAK